MGRQARCKHCGLRIFLSALGPWLHWDSSKPECELRAEPE
jgi:hypothetical protein